VQRQTALRSVNRGHSDFLRCSILYRLPYSSVSEQSAGTRQRSPWGEIMNKIIVWSAGLRASLFALFENVSVRLQRAGDALANAKQRAIEEHRRWQEVLLERKGRLGHLLANSLEAIVVTNDKRRLLAANPPALALFGVSPKNLERFAIDAFLPASELLEFERHGPLFLRGRERRGECEIRRLDGSRRLVEFTFQANFVPRRHLSRFRDVTDRERGKVRDTEKIAQARTQTWDTDGSVRGSFQRLCHSFRAFQQAERVEPRRESTPEDLAIRARH
jgi:PAS domain-containing protein